MNSYVLCYNVSVISWRPICVVRADSAEEASELCGGSYTMQETDTSFRHKVDFTKVTDQDLRFQTPETDWNRIAFLLERPLIQ